jgi:hypothetical protein
MGDWIWALIPVTALMIPVVAIFTHHQQKMAQILNQNAGDHNEIAALRKEIAELKSLVHQQAITLDNIASAQRMLTAPPPTPSVAERLSQ